MGFIKRSIRMIGLRIEELILVGIILLNVLDFFEILPGDLDYIKKIVSWSALGYLLYKASLTKLFFGKRHRHMDAALILTYFTMIFKNFIAFSAAIISEASARLSFFYLFLIKNAPIIEEFSFYIGGTLLFILALYSAYRYDISVPSLMHVIHEEGPHPKSVGKFVLRFSIILLVFVFFFITVFNLMMEWLALAVDAPLVMLGIFFYIFKAKDFGTESLIYKLGNLGESFYERFIDLFHSKRRIFLGIGGMLVLHLLTDIGNFLIPHLIGLHDHIYFHSLGPGHTPLPALFLQDLQLFSGVLQRGSLFLVYALNAIGMGLLLLGPGFLWYTLFRDKPITVSNGVLGIFSASVTAFLLAPAFRISSIADAALVGVDIQTQALAGGSFPPFTALVISVAIGFMVYLLCHHNALKRLYILGSVLVSMAFFGIYIYFFFIDVSNYYVYNIALLFAHSKIFVATLLMLFFTTTIIFYVGGFLLFLYELVRN